jgi:hypothetical protein
MLIVDFRFLIEERDHLPPSTFKAPRLAHDFPILRGLPPQAY